MQTEKQARLHNQQRLCDLARNHHDYVKIFSAHSAAEYHHATNATSPAR